ncbi:hypothetical protein TRIP_E340001 [uncultured Spirochaetota bacterium]|nr:hypothetical protein TRIP_E340001 [uncultured Spirochaetota bacterium]
MAGYRSLKWEKAGGKEKSLATREGECLHVAQSVGLDQ